VFDLEIDAPDPDDVVRIVTALEPTFGGINLEDIKAPDCFLIEERLRAVMTIPVFHDDQHGTAIVTGAALLNAVELTGRSLVHPRIVIGGAGAAAIASAHLLCTLGVPRENIILVDTRGVIHAERVDGMNAYKRLFATRLPARTLADALAGADVFVGLSAGGIVTREMVRTITQEMKIAAVRALAEIAKAPVPRDVLQAHGIDALAFGPGYLIPKPLDSRVPIRVAVAVAEAAMRGVISYAGVPLDAYEHTLERRLGWHR
jgi:malic enzyme